MSRRRYLSTKISHDAKINRLATKHGDFAALLYTWMIPHAEDDGTLSGDPEELLMTVMPGRRDKDIADIEAALTAMHDLGLVIWSRTSERPMIRFPDSFYQYQSYITERRRKTAQPGNDADSDTQNSAKQRKTAQNATSLKLKSSFPFPLESSPSGEDSYNAAVVDANPGIKPPDAPATAAAAASEMEVTWSEPRNEAVGEITSAATSGQNHWRESEARRTAEAVARIVRLPPREVTALVNYIRACPHLSHERILAEVESFAAWLTKSRKGAEARVFYNRWLKGADQEALRDREAAQREREREASLSNGHQHHTPPSAGTSGANGTAATAPDPGDALYQFNVERARAKLVS